MFTESSFSSVASSSSSSSSGVFSADDYETIIVRDHVGYYKVGIDGTRTWFPDELPHGQVPIVGCQFVSIDQAYNFYVAYGKKGGFDVRRGGEYKAVGYDIPTTKYLLCSREGFLQPKDKASVDNVDVDLPENGVVEDGGGSGDFQRFRDIKKKQIRRKPTFRCGCLALILIKKKGKIFEVISFTEGHNHPLVAERDMIFMKNSRNVGYTKQHFLYQVSNANFGPAIGFRLMKQLHGGFDNVGVTVDDCKNEKKKINVFIRDQDAQMAVEKLISRKLHSPDFFVKHFKGPDNRLAGLFWADEEGIRNFATFGDIVSFDATFRSNKYQMVFVPFTGINHHNRCITFAAALLADESALAYIWLLKEFKEAFGKAPEVVITDQDPSMKIAIAEVFCNTVHRFCMWHIMMKLGTKVGAELCNRTDFKRRISDIVWTDQITPEVFEREWNCMINEFDLGENKWLADMFDLRQSWIPAYLRHVPMAGLMRTTSRSESENHFFGKWTNPRLTLIEFLSHYDTAIEYQRYIERKNDHDSRYKTPAFKTDLQMEKEACKLFTRTIFFDVQDEMFNSYKYCIAMSVVENGNTERYSVRDSQYHIFKGSDEFPIYQVEFCKSEIKLECSCNRYESYGLLCRHAFYVLRMNDVKEFPRKYLHKRWLKNVKPSSSARRMVSGVSDAVQTEVTQLYHIFESTIDRLVHKVDNLHIFKDKMKELLKQAEIDVPVVPKMNNKAAICALLGVNEPENENDKVLNPNLRRARGPGCFSRLKPVTEVTAEELSKRRTCGVCGEKAGHNKRTCTGLSERANLQATPNQHISPKNQAVLPRRSGLRSNTPK